MKNPSPDDRIECLQAKDRLRMSHSPLALSMEGAQRKNLDGREAEEREGNQKSVGRQSR